jgi:hypothetical protein
MHPGRSASTHSPAAWTGAGASDRAGRGGATPPSAVRARQGFRLRRARLRAAVALMACLAIAACGLPGGQPPERMALGAGGPVIAGPSGFCVDTGRSHEDGGGAFVLLGSCAALSRNPLAPRAAAPAVLTATVAPAGSGAQPLPERFAQMRAFFASEAGRAALSRSGDAASVKITRTDVAGDLMLIALTDSAAAAAAGLQPETWRGWIGIRGRIVTLAVLGLADRPLDGATMRALVEEFARALRAANPDPGAT